MCDRHATVLAVAKPHPAPLIASSMALGLTLPQITYIGDSEQMPRTPKRAGAPLRPVQPKG